MNITTVNNKTVIAFTGRTYTFPLFNATQIQQAQDEATVIQGMLDDDNDKGAFSVLKSIQTGFYEASNG